MSINPWIWNLPIMRKVLRDWLEERSNYSAKMEEEALSVEEKKLWAGRFEGYQDTLSALMRGRFDV